LAPGFYNTVKVNSKGTLILNGPGNWNMKVLDTESSAILSINVSGGAVNIKVVNDLDFDDNVKVNVTGGSTSLVTFSTRQNSEVNVGKNAIIRGTLHAPNAKVHFATGCAYKGELRAETISLDPKVKFQHHNSTLPFPKESEEFAADESEIADDQLITGYQLEQNYPNPFNPSTTISFILPQAGKVKAQIYDLQGQLVRTLANGEFESGRHELYWDARHESGAIVATGVYLYQIVVTGENGEARLVQTKRMTLVK
jgi:hypothetical protein